MHPSAAFFCFCMIAVYSSGEKTSKAKRDVSGLFPFPRVGRGDVSWSSQPGGLRQVKRQGLIPFPRVGRQGGDDGSERKRGVTENGGGMWFGPRLGRLQKRNFPVESSWALVQIRAFFPGFKGQPANFDIDIPNRLAYLTIRKSLWFTFIGRKETKFWQGIFGRI